MSSSYLSVISDYYKIEKKINEKQKRKSEVNKNKELWVAGDSCIILELPKLHNTRQDNRANAEYPRLTNEKSIFASDVGQAIRQTFSSIIVPVGLATIGIAG